MKRPTINLVIDAVAAVLLVGMIATGYILNFALPPGTNKSHWLWGVTRHEWGRIHLWMSVLLLLVLLLHLALHWKWVVTVIAQRLGAGPNRKTEHLRSGVMALVVLLIVVGGFALVTHLSVRELESPHRQPVVDDGRAASDADADVSMIELWERAYPILVESCLHCHGPEHAAAGFRIDRRADSFGTTGGPVFVIPGRSDESELIAIVEGRRPQMRMASSHELPAAEIAVLRAWIDAGAAWPEPAEAPP